MTPDNMSSVSSDSFSQRQVEFQEKTAEARALIVANQQDASAARLRDVEPEDQAAMKQKIETQELAKRSTQKVSKFYQIFTSRGDTDGFADEFTKRFHEYHLDPRILSALAYEDLGLKFNEDSDPELIIKVVKDRMSTSNEEVDIAMLDKGLEFLIEVVQSQIDKVEAGSPEHARLIKLKEKLDLAKQEHFQLNEVDILVTEKIIGAVDAVVNVTGKTVKEILTRYREIVHNLPDFQTLRKYYEGKTYKEMKLELQGLSRYLNVNFKRGNLENAELSQLAKTAKKMQALDHVFLEALNQYKTFFKGYLKMNDLVEVAA